MGNKMEKEFIEALYNSIANKEMFALYREEKYGKTKYYCNNKYRDYIAEDFIKLKVKSNEVRIDKRNNLASICSLSSSGRFCYLDFHEEKPTFEMKLYNDVSSSPTKMDAVNDNVFYECKCREPITREKEKLSSSYCGTKLFSEFKITNIEIKTKTDKNGNIVYKKNGEPDQYMMFNMSDIGVDYPGYYTDLRFNVKQLICHLIAIANTRKGKTPQKTLQYVFYTPTEEEISKHPLVNEAYVELKNEIEAIWKSKNIIDFLTNHGIILPKPIYTEVSKIKDFVYETVYLNKK